MQQQHVILPHFPARGPDSVVWLSLRNRLRLAYAAKLVALQCLCNSEHRVQGMSYESPLVKKAPNFVDRNIRVLLREHSTRRHVRPVLPICLQLTRGRVPSLTCSDLHLLCSRLLVTGGSRDRLTHRGRSVKTETVEQGQELAYARAAAALPTGSIRRRCRRARYI